ncbi:MAG: hypothetical protein WC584_04300 [Candidatus Pacearchaeota archaeon]
MTRTEHYGDCTIYQSLTNIRPESGICTCGYGLDYLRETGGDTLHLYSEELKQKMEKEMLDHPVNPESLNLLNKIFGEKK